ncbi:YqjD family protein [Bdellovibrio bacteriovorus]
MEPTPNDFKRDLGNIKENLKSGAESVRKNVKQGIEETNWREKYEDLQEQIQSRASDAVDASEDFIKEHPFYTVLGAAAVGLVAGLLLRGGRD